MYSCQVPPLAWTNWEAGLSNKRANKTTHATRYLPSLYRCLEDRKSTRLNSSHLVISYAVFCLKKKTTHPGYAFSAPDSMYRQFETDFEFEETPDQAKGIEDVLADIQQPKPMDRLGRIHLRYGQ